MEIRVRMAPSPTGKLHLGTAYTTLFNYLFAKKNNGKFILRIEDTDKERSKKEFEENILEGLRWLGLNWDEGPIRQSERLKQYKASAQKLLDQGKAYLCFCTPEDLDKERSDQQKLGLPQIYLGRCRSLTQKEIEANKKAGLKSAIRFKMPENRGKIEFEDLLHGKISFDAKLLGDMVILRANELPLYNFAVVVDDIDMAITHVLRGEDHLSNTPKQIVLFEAFDALVPKFAHWPNVLNPDRIGKLSKRNNATSIDNFKKEGYLPEAIINYLALLGWTMPDEREIMTKEEMEHSFDLSKMRLSPAAYNQDKFDWINGEYIRQMGDGELIQRFQEYLVDHPAKEKIAPLVPLVKERIKKLSDFIPLTDFIFNEPEYDLKVFERIKIESQKQVLESIYQTLKQLPASWEKEEFEEKLQRQAQDLGIPNREFFQLLRVAVSGQLITPPLFESMKIIGEEKALNRIKKVLENVLDGGHTPRSLLDPRSFSAGDGEGG